MSDVPEKSCQLRRSTQHLLAVYLPEFGHDFAGTLRSFVDTGFIQLPQSFACGVLSGFPQNWQMGPYNESLWW